MNACSGCGHRVALVNGYYCNSCHTSYMEQVNSARAAREWPGADRKPIPDWHEEWAEADAHPEG